jgi:hypothetical protein
MKLMSDYLCPHCGATAAAFRAGHVTVLHPLWCPQSQTPAADATVSVQSHGSAHGSAPDDRPASAGAVRGAFLGGQVVALAAWLMSLVTAAGSEIIDRCPALTSTIVAAARSAMNR